MTSARTLFEGDGEIRALLRDYDWSLSALGPPQDWPPPLATALRMVLDSAFPMFIAWGPDLGFLYNDAYAAIMGKKHPDALGGRFEQIWKEIWSDIKPIVERALSNKSAFFEDLPLSVVRHGYAEHCFFTFSYSPLHDTDGTVGGLYCTVVETTDRVLSEQRADFELKVSDALRPLASPEDVIACASSLLGERLNLARVIYGECNEADDTFSVSRDWVAPGYASLAEGEFQLDDFGPAVIAEMSAGKVVVSNDTGKDPRTARFINAYGSTKICSFLAVPLIKRGRLAAFLGLHCAEPRNWTDSDRHLAQDIAERIWLAVEATRAQAALRAERDRSQYIFDTIAEGLMLLDQEWKVRYLNAEGLRIVGLSIHQVMGRSHWDIWPETVNTECATMYRQVMQSGKSGAAEYLHTLPDTSPIWVEVRAYPTKEGGIASFFRDITTRKRAEQALVEADRRKDEFLAMLAHELRNPLAPISAAAHSLSSGAFDEERARQSSEIIGRQVTHMTALLNDLLDVSRVTQGLVTLVKEATTVRDIVEEAIEQVMPQIHLRQQQLTVRLPPDEVSVVGDKTRLVQVLANLLNNAAKYTPDRRQIDVGADVDGQELVITVRDEGVGMDAELVKHVFDLFAQAERSSDRSLGGLGLGLTLVKNLVELHGGTVDCLSAGVGEGSTFVVALPLVPAGAEGPQKSPMASHPTGGQLRILVVDDNVDAAQALGMVLMSYGHEVTIEHNSRHALDRTRRERFDAYLLDIGLPDMDGYELARRLRGDPGTASAMLIAITGYGQQSDRERSAQAGFDHHFIKPVAVEQLIRLLAAVTRRLQQQTP